MANKELINRRFFQMIDCKLEMYLYAFLAFYDFNTEHLKKALPSVCKMSMCVFLFMERSPVSNSDLKNDPDPTSYRRF